MRIPRIEIDRTRRRILAQLAGLVTGSVVALTLVQFSAARQARQDGRAPSSAARICVAA